MSWVLVALNLSAQHDCKAAEFNVDLAYLPHFCQNKEGYMGYMGGVDSILIPFEYEYIDTTYGFSNFLIAVKDNRYGIIDKKNNIMLPFNHRYIRYLSPHFAEVAREYTSKGLIDDKGQLVLPYEFFQIELVNDSLILASRSMGAPTELYNPQGEHIGHFYPTVKHTGYSRPIYHKEYFEIYGRIIDYDSRLMGVADKCLNIVIPAECSNIYWVENNWAFIAKYGIYQPGLFNIRKQTFLELPYWRIEQPDLAGNLTVTPFNGRKSGLIDTNGIEIFPPDFLWVKCLNAKGHYLLKKNDGARIIDTKGNILLDTIYKQIYQGRLFGVVSETPLWIFYESKSKKSGIWHNELGLIQPAVADKIIIVNDSLYICSVAENMALYHCKHGMISSEYPLLELWIGGGLIFTRKKGERASLLLTYDGKEAFEFTDDPENINGLAVFRDVTNKYSALDYNTLQYAPFESLTPLKPYMDLPAEFREKADALKRQSPMYNWQLWGRDSNGILLYNTKAELYRLE
jgi:hypothetical protein